jgi:hypothetical protein
LLQNPFPAAMIFFAENFGGLTAENIFTLNFMEQFLFSPFTLKAGAASNALIPLNIASLSLFNYL